MYADRVEAGADKSVKERLNGNVADKSSRRRPVTGKRQRQDDGKWEHDLYEDVEANVPNHKLGALDLRLKLQRKGVQQSNPSGKGSIAGVLDLRDKLSGTMRSQPVNKDPQKPKSVVEAAKPAKNDVSLGDLPVDITKVENPALKKKKKVQLKNKKSESLVDGFLESLGLEKYAITFQAEEVDMTALLHMSDEDLKALGIPMGPRKKIRLALDTRA